MSGQECSPEKDCRGFAREAKVPVESHCPPHALSSPALVVEHICPVSLLVSSISAPLNPSGLSARAPSSMEALYCFDFDDTLVVSNCRVHTVEGPMSTREFATKKAPLASEDPFREFRDVETCSLSPGPFHATFIKALRERQPVAVITARDNPKKDFLRLLSRAAEMGGECLHDQVHVYCCNNMTEWDLPGETPAERKCAAILDFVGRFPSAASVGFSDDDPRNFAAVGRLFEMLEKTRPECKWRTYPCGSAADVVASIITGPHE